MSHKDYEVLRSHIGDRPYAVGDTRSANPQAVAHLIPNVLKLETRVKSKDGEEIVTLTDIPGVGPATAKKLEAAGFDTVAKVQALTSDELREVGISPANVAKIIPETPGK